MWKEVKKWEKNTYWFWYFPIQLETSSSGGERGFGLKWLQGAWRRTGWCSFQSSIGSPLSYTCQLKEFHHSNQTSKRMLETLFPSVLSMFRPLRDFLHLSLFWPKAPNFIPAEGLWLSAGPTCYKIEWPQSFQLLEAGLVINELPPPSHHYVCNRNGRFLFFKWSH